MSESAVDLMNRERLAIRGELYFPVRLPDGKECYLIDRPLLPREQWTFEGVSEEEEGPAAVFRIYQDEGCELVGFRASQLPNDFLGVEDLERLGVQLSNILS